MNALFGMKRLWVGLGASALVIAVVAGVKLGLTTLLGVTFEEGEPKPAEGLRLQTENAQPNQPGQAQSSPIARYPGLSFCIQAIGVDEALEVLEAVKEGQRAANRRYRLPFGATGLETGP